MQRTAIDKPTVVFCQRADRYGYRMTVDYQGRRCDLHVSNAGAIGWSSSWSLVYRMNDAGFLTDKCHGPSTYNHTDLIVPQEWFGGVA